MPTMISLGPYTFLIGIYLYNLYNLIGYVGLTIFDKGSILIIGPGLIKIFNNDLGTQLYPIIMTGSLGALLISPLL